jgi:hypothetical protein
MGLKDWIAGKVAGPQSYGDVLGRKARENGSALANVLFMSHGSMACGGPTIIFDTVEEMEAAGFKPRFEEMTEMDLNFLSDEERLLFKNLQTAMISLRIHCEFEWGFAKHAAREYFQVSQWPGAIFAQIDG